MGEPFEHAIFLKNKYDALSKEESEISEHYVVQWYVGIAGFLLFVTQIFVSPFTAGACFAASIGCLAFAVPKWFRKKKIEKERLQISETFRKNGLSIHGLADGWLDTIPDH